MNISFDLDSTLIPNGDEFDCEPLSIFQKFCGHEPIRKGFIDLVLRLEEKRIQVHIYTSSYRPKWRIRWCFQSHGIKVKKIITQPNNLKTLANWGRSCSKYPPAFGFDIHVDDSLGVEKEGQEFNFRVIRIDQRDKAWVNTVMNYISAFEKSQFDLK